MILLYDQEEGQIDAWKEMTVLDAVMVNELLHFTADPLGEMCGMKWT